MDLKEMPAQHACRRSDDSEADLPSGYRMTEVGPVPEDWDVKLLGELLERGYLGGNYPNSDSESSHPLIKMGNVGRGSFDTSSVQYIPEHVTPNASHRLQIGDVLLNTRNTLDLVGKVAIWRGELPVAYYNSNLMRLDFDPEVIDQGAYLSYALNSQRAIASLRAIATGTTSVAAIYGRDLMRLALAAPSKTEQGAISRALSEIDGFVSSLEALIAKKQAVKRATMQQILTGQARLPGFRGNWSRRALGDFGRWRGGLTPSMANRSYWHGGTIPWLSSGDVRPGAISDTCGLLTERALSETAVPIMPPGSVVVVIRSGILRRFLPVAHTLRAVAINQDIRALPPGPYHDPRYLAHALAGLQHRILLDCTKAGTTVESIDSKWFRAFEIPLPSLREQQAIATVLSDMDDEIAALEQRRDKARAIKQGMMQQLLTGRIRLVKPQPAAASV